MHLADVCNLQPQLRTRAIRLCVLNCKSLVTKQKLHTLRRQNNIVSTPSISNYKSLLTLLVHLFCYKLHTLRRQNNKVSTPSISNYKSLLTLLVHPFCYASRYNNMSKWMTLKSQRSAPYFLASTSAPLSLAPTCLTGLGLTCMCPEYYYVCSRAMSW